MLLKTTETLEDGRLLESYEEVQAFLPYRNGEDDRPCVRKVFDPDVSHEAEILHPTNFEIYDHGTRVGTISVQPKKEEVPDEEAVKTFFTATINGKRLVFKAMEELTYEDIVTDAGYVGTPTVTYSYNENGENVKGTMNPGTAFCIMADIEFTVMHTLNA